MPAYYTHLYFAEQLISKMPYAPNAVIRLYPDAYRLGALGADVLRPMGRLSAELDVINPYNLFESTASHIYESGSKCQLSYMLGFITHYLLDSRINPYLYYLSEHGVGYYFEDKSEMLSYEDIRSSVDHHIMRAHLDGRQDAIKVWAVQQDVVEDIGKLYERAVSRVVGHHIEGDAVVKMMEARPFTESKGVLLPDLDYLNRNHRTWETVRNGEWTTDMGIEELLIKLETLALKMIDDYMARVRSALELNQRAFRINHLGVLL